MQAAEKEDALLRPEEVAALLAVSPHTLAVWRSAKRYDALSFVKIGAAVRYRRAAVEAFIKAREVAGGK